MTGNSHDTTLAAVLLGSCRERSGSCSRAMNPSIHAAAQHSNARVRDISGQSRRGEPPRGRRVFGVDEEVAAEAQAVFAEALVDDAGRRAECLQEGVTSVDAAALRGCPDDGERGRREAAARRAYGGARQSEGADIPAAPLERDAGALQLRFGWRWRGRAGGFGGAHWISARVSCPWLEEGRACVGLERHGCARTVARARARRGHTSDRGVSFPARSGRHHGGPRRRLQRSTRADIGRRFWGGCFAADRRGCDGTVEAARVGSAAGRCNEQHSDSEPARPRAGELEHGARLAPRSFPLHWEKLLLRCWQPSRGPARVACCR
jgi:hypothetical protein